MAFVEKRGPNRWRARYRGPDHRERSKTFARRADAERWLHQVEAEKARGAWIDPRLGRKAFGDWAREWFEGAAHLRPSSRARVESDLRVYLLPRFGARALATITPVEVRSFVADLSAAGLSPASVRKAYNVLSPMMRAAVEAGLIGRSPCLGVRLPAAQAREMRFLHPEEVSRLAGAVPDRYRALVALGAYGGLRFGELAGLRVRDVDFLRSRLTVAEAIVEVGGRLYRGRTKTGPRRMVTLPRFLTEALAAHLAAFPPGPEGLVFTAPEGGPLRRSAFRPRVWLPATRGAGLEGLRVHDLRHTAAALAIEAGAHPKAIAERLGHASITTTLNTYGHLFPAIDEELAGRLDEMARRPLAAWMRPGALREDSDPATAGPQKAL